MKNGGSVDHDFEAERAPTPANGATVGGDLGLKTGISALTNAETATMAVFAFYMA
jgi:hypothetical protein